MKRCVSLALFWGMMAWCLFPLSGRAAAQDSPGPYRVAVQVSGVEDGDKELAHQVQRRAIQLLSEKRGFEAFGYVGSSPEAELKHFQRLVDDATRKLMPAISGSVYVEGKKAVQDGYILGKRLTGVLDSCSLGKMYRAMAMVQSMDGDASLAVEYWMTFRNLCPETRRSSENYHQRYLDLYDQSESRYGEKGQVEVALTVEPPEAEIWVDGRRLKDKDEALQLWGGNHLVQARLEGYYSEGWLRSVELNGREWKLEMRPLEGKSRRDEYLKRLEVWFAKPATQEIDPETTRILYELRTLLGGEAVLVMFVSRDKEDVSVRGAFASSFEVTPVNGRIHFGAELLDGVDTLVFRATDVEGQKKRQQERRTARKEADLATWGRQLEARLSDVLEKLTARQEEWSQAGEPEKVRHFAETREALSQLRQELKETLSEGAGDAVLLEKNLRGISDRLAPLEEKSRSLLSWDVSGAAAARRMAELEATISAGKTLAEGLLNTLGTGRDAATRKRRQEVERALTGLQRAATAVRKAPRDAKALSVLFGVVVEINRLNRLYGDKQQ